MQMERRVLPLLALVLVGILAGACAGPGSEVVTRLEAGQDEMQDEIEALKRAVEASYDRERAMAERLRLAEEHSAGMRDGATQLQTQVAHLASRLDTAAAARGPAAPSPEIFQSAPFAVMDAYRVAFASYTNREYETALGQFAEIVATAPSSNRADNAQYWMGECYYGLGKFRQALTEFTKVFAYESTGKADDAQFKMARCYLALGERDQSLAAFQKVLDVFPESEYVERARKESRYLRGP